MPLFRVAALLAALACAATAAGQGATVVFDEDDAPGTGYYDASLGAASGGDALDLAGPGADRMPIEAGHAFSGAVSGRLTYRHVAGGAWGLVVGAPGFPALDLTGADSLVLYLNGPAGLAEVELPRIGLVDADGDATALLPIDLGGIIGFSPSRSGFLSGSTTDAAFAVSYLDALPANLPRPGYPEDLTITFADVPLDTSTAAVGLPAIPAHFRIDAASGLRLDFRFRDVDADGTLSDPGDYVQILTEDPASGTLRPTWRVALAGAPPAQPPGEGDVYLLAVNTGGLDGDPATWQRFRFPLADFGPPGAFDRDRVRGVRFANGSGETVGLRTLWVDYVAAVEGPGAEGPPPPSGITADVGDATVVLRWAPVSGALATHVYRQADPAEPFVRLTDRPIREPNFADLRAENGEDYVYVLRSIGPGNTPGPDSDPVAAAPEAGGGDPFLDLVAELAFRYFWEQANPANGLVKDRSTAASPSSIAAVGFGLTALAVGIDRGWVTHEAGRQRVLNTLRFFWTCPQGPAASGTCGYKGFFYHFLDMQTGHRAGTNELSTIDTALLLGGVVDAKQYFTGDHPDEAEIRALADSIYYRTDWAWAQNGEASVTHGWRPETGFLGARWIGYNEAMILYVLALGSPTFPVGPEAWDAWTAGYGNQWGTFYGYTFLSFPPLFGHQYSHLWIDFRGIRDAYMRGRGIDYFENSRRATLAQRAYAIANPLNWPNYGPDEWGFTASDDPGGYLAHGAPPPQNENGTITPTAPGGSIAFAPEETRAALAHMYTRYVASLWGPYGFRDAYNVDRGWTATDFLGIDQGPFVIMIENLRTEAVWDRFMANEDVRRGLERAGFEPAPVAAEPDGAEPERATLAGSVPNPLRGRAEVRFTLPAPGAVSLRVFDLLGREVAVLLDGPAAAGAHAVPFEAARLPSGVYVVRLRTPEAVLARKMTVIR